MAPGITQTRPLTVPFQSPPCSCGPSLLPAVPGAKAVGGRGTSEPRIPGELLGRFMCTQLYATEMFYTLMKYKSNSVDTHSEVKKSISKPEFYFNLHLQCNTWGARFPLFLNRGRSKTALRLMGHNTRYLDLSHSF